MSTLASTCTCLTGFTVRFEGRTGSTVKTSLGAEGERKNLNKKFDYVMALIVFWILYISFTTRFFGFC